MRDPLKAVLSQTRDVWDIDSVRPSIRRNFKKVLQCRTPALGSEVFTSSTEQKLVHHTCKSRACPSCGWRATNLWQREQWALLPEIPYRGVTLTMPDSLWEFFRMNRHMLHDLPVIGAKVLEQWAKSHYGANLLVMVIRHTFGRHLNFNPHLHVLVSAGGFHMEQQRWLAELKIDKASLMQSWRCAVITYLRAAHRRGLIADEAGKPDIGLLLELQEERWWSIDIANFQSKEHFLRYAGRYARRPPIAQYRFTSITDKRVQFRTNDHRQRREVMTSYKPSEFVSLLAEHVPDHYEHSVRRFGLLAPRASARYLSELRRQTGQGMSLRPTRISWRLSLLRNFGIDPLLDSTGERMRWIKRLPAKAK